MKSPPHSDTHTRARAIARSRAQHTTVICGWRPLTQPLARCEDRVFATHLGQRYTGCTRRLKVLVQELVHGTTQVPAQRVPAAPARGAKA